jgi:hypothetical protein
MNDVTIARITGMFRATNDVLTVSVQHSWVRRHLGMGGPS